MMDNSIEADLKKVITWQYDNATNLVALIMSMEEFFSESTQKFWDDWPTDVANIDTANDFGLSVWGMLVGVKRFILEDGQGGGTPISSELYRRIIKAKVKLLDGNASMKDYCDFVYAIFGGGVAPVDGLDMSLTFTDNGLTGEEALLFAQHMDEIVVYPAGVRDNAVSDSLVFGFDGQQKVTQSDPNLGGLDESSFVWRTY